MGIVVKDDSWRISDKLWEIIEPLLPKPIDNHPKKGHRPRVPNRDAMNAILFVLRTGCQWNALDATGICSSSSAHRRFQEWTDVGVFEKFWEKGLIEYDVLKGLDWNWLSMDGAITKAPLGGKKTGNSPVDRSKKGTKRSLLTEAKGIPIGLTVDGANRHDVKLFSSTVNNIVIDRPEPTIKNPQGMCLDAGYVGDEVQELSEQFGFTLHVRPRGEETEDIKNGVGKKARRWVVERTHSWMNRFRGLLIRWNKKCKNYLGLLHLACGIITWRATGLLG